MAKTGFPAHVSFYKWPRSVIGGILLTAMALLTLAGCGSRNSSNSQPPPQTTPQQQTTPAQQPPTATGSDTTMQTNTNASRSTILFFGNSITAGYGTSPEVAFPNRIQLRLDSLGLNYRAINAGNSGETSEGGLTRIAWVLKGIKEVEIFVLELGANDGLRGLSLADTRQNLGQIIDAVRQHSPNVKVVIAGMQVPPNLGQEYTTEFRSLFKELANRYNTTLIPFILQGVGGEPHLNIADGIHPNAAGHEIVAQNVWQVLQPLITPRAPI